MAGLHDVFWDFQFALFEATYTCKGCIGILKAPPQPSRDTASDGGTSLVAGSWDDEKNTVRN